MKQSGLLLILLIVTSYITAQILTSPDETQQKIPFHKFYLHTDREFYFTGDTVWFSGYLLNPQTHAPEQTDCNLYIELVDSAGTIVKKDLFLIDNGFCPGQIILNDRGLEGNYLLRAYTDLLEAFGGDFIFSKALRISPVKNMAGFNSLKNEKRITKINIELFPEGGFLLAGNYNQMAFKATDQSGRAVEVSGKLQNIYGDKIAEFTSTYKGMGIIHIIPDTNNDYFLEIEGYPNVDYTFPEIRKVGTKLMVRGLDDGDWNLNIMSNNAGEKESFYLAFLHRGELQHFTEVTKKEIWKTIRVKKKSLQNGINRLVLLNQNYEPISERLVFADKKTGQLTVKLPQAQFKPREKVEMEIKRSGVFRNDVIHFSISVFDENAIPQSGITQNIKSYLLIDSELRGYISNPADYFRNDSDINSLEKLNLLMMTHGWSNYTWNYLDQIKQLPEYKTKRGLDITGTIKNSTGKRIIADSEVILSVTDSQGTFMNTTSTDSMGNYNFENLQFYDSATVFVQALNHKNKLNTTVTIDSIRFSSPELNASESAKMGHYSEMPVPLLRTKYFNEAELKEFFPDRDTRWIEEVEVMACKPKPKEKTVESYRPYTEPTYTEKINETHYAAPDVLEHLQGRIPGFEILVGKGSRGGRALFLIDGIPVSNPPGGQMNDIRAEDPIFEVIRNIPMNNIERVEVLKHGTGTFYGMEGANGVVNIILRKGGEYIPPADILKGTIVKRIKGFSKYREFYSPEYTDKNRRSEAPDYRTTLYWNPSIKMAGKNTILSFFTSENHLNYKIRVEGISENGQIYLGETEFEVAKTINDSIHTGEQTTPLKSDSVEGAKSIIEEKTLKK